MRALVVRFIKASDGNGPTKNKSELNGDNNICFSGPVCVSFSGWVLGGVVRDSHVHPAQELLQVFCQVRVQEDMQLRKQPSGQQVGTVLCG